MRARQFLSMDNTGLCVVDVQEKLFPLCERFEVVGKEMATLIRAAEVLGLPIVVTEQYPQGLGKTAPYLQKFLPADQQVFEKTTFSSFHDEAIRSHMESLPVRNWVLIGIEAHVCVLQTAKDLLQADYGVIACNDAISSRSIYDFSTGIAELRDAGARISSVELVLFELLRDAKHPKFKEISNLIKQAPQ